MKKDTEKIIKFLKEGKIGVLPTDTVYGLHCLASNKEQIDKIHLLKKEDSSIPLITLIDDIKYLSDFGVKVGDFEKLYIDEYWPGNTTFIFNTVDGGTRAFRIPKSDFMISILKETGPLTSTSANTHGNPTSLNVEEAVKYFGDSVDFYVDDGDLNNPPSRIFKLDDGVIIKIR